MHALPHEDEVRLQTFQISPFVTISFAAEAELISIQVSKQHFALFKERKTYPLKAKEKDFRYFW